MQRSFTTDWPPPRGRLYTDRLDCYLGGALVLNRARGRVQQWAAPADRMLDYRHFIEALKRKPQNLQRDWRSASALFRGKAYRRTWEQRSRRS